MTLEGVLWMLKYNTKKLSLIDWMYFLVYYSNLYNSALTQKTVDSGWEWIAVGWICE